MVKLGPDADKKKGQNPVNRFKITKMEQELASSGKVLAELEVVLSERELAIQIQELATRIAKLKDSKNRVANAITRVTAEVAKLSVIKLNLLGYKINLASKAKIQELTSKEETLARKNLKLAQLDALIEKNTVEQEALQDKARALTVRYSVVYMQHKKLQEKINKAKLEIVNIETAEMKIAEKELLLKFRETTDFSHKFLLKLAKKEAAAMLDRVQVFLSTVMDEAEERLHKAVAEATLRKRKFIRVDGAYFKLKYPAEMRKAKAGMLEECKKAWIKKWSKLLLKLCAEKLDEIRKENLKSAAEIRSAAIMVGKIEARATKKIEQAEETKETKGLKDRVSGTHDVASVANMSIARKELTGMGEEIEAKQRKLNPVERVLRRVLLTRNSDKEDAILTYLAKLAAKDTKGSEIVVELAQAIAELKKNESEYSIKSNGIELMGERFGAIEYKRALSSTDLARRNNIVKKLEAIMAKIQVAGSSMRKGTSSR